jgi:glycerophosphoryl diester phosphodiesterase
MQKESSSWTKSLAALVLAGAGMTNAVEVDLPVIIAHRGASAVAPENTKSAIVEACRMGAKVIEFDVRQTSDGELVLFHDKDLERIAGTKASLESKKWDEISQLDVGKWFGETFTGEKPIRLKEAIELCRDGGAIALIEHKTGDAERYAGVIRELEAGGEVIVQSFNWQFLQEFQVAMDSVPTGALGSKELSGERLGQLKALAPDWVGWKFSDLSEANLKSLQGQGYRVALWTVNDPEEARKWLERGVEGVITDYPDKMLELLEAE